jgi:5-methylcytosine-specific restriction endonuclease McrA
MNIGEMQRKLSIERRPGHADLRRQAFARDEYTCSLCKSPVTDRTGEADHLQPVRYFKRPVDANFLDNYVTLCIDCHRKKTESDRIRESRMR